MTFPSFVRFFLLAWLAFILTGCSAIPDTQSWFAPKQRVAQNQPAPQTAPSVYMPPPAGPGLVRPLPPSATAPPVLPPNVKIKAGILLPLSGKNGPLGQAMLNAAQQAVFDVADQHFELMPRDTGSSDGEAETAARDAIASGAQILIGPVFASAVNRVKPVAALSGINMLALSSDATLADQNVFVMGFAPGAQVDRIVAFAHAHGVHNFAALLPKNAYGDLMRETFQAAVARAGDQLIALETFDPARHDSEAAITALAAKRDQIDGLFLPEAGGDITAIASQLAAAGFDRKHMHVLGTGLWDAPETAHVDFLAGGWYAAPDPRARQNFLKAYAKNYGQPPPLLATLAYDATALAALLAKQGGHFDRAALTNPSGFAGVDGIFRLTDQGLVERGLAVLEVGGGGGKVVDPAPATFAAVRP
jgi:ABC-type branched-subunit amino acid transport system substrate-binding protein